jgi:hypothetical protein
MFVKHPIRSLVLVFAALVCGSLPAFAEDSTSLFAGTSLGVITIAQVREEVATTFFASGELSVGRRGSLMRERYYSLAANFRGTINNDLLFYDQEYISLKIGFGNNSFEAALLTSLIDDGSGSTYFNPSWHASVEMFSLPNSATVSVIYTGFLASIYGESDDQFYQGVNALYRVDPTITLGYEIAAGGGWEYYFEQQLYDQAGDLSDRERHDLVLNVLGTIDGFAGYFTEWAVTGGLAYRISNVSLLERSEDRLEATMDAALFTSPHQSWTIDGTLSAEGMRYISRPVRNIDGTTGDENLLLLDIDASGEAEWSPNQEIYLALSAVFGYTLSNDPFLGGWYAKAVFALTL